jgi:hypothetical protein
MIWKFLLFLNKYNWRKILLFLVVSFLLAIPWPIYKTIGKFDKNSKSDSFDVRVINIPTQVDSFGQSFFTAISGIKLYSMNKFLCLKNRNKILLDGVEKQSYEVLDSKEGGAMSFKIFYADNKNVEEIYAKKDKTKCLVLMSDYSFATTTNSVMAREVFPAEAPTLELTKDRVIIRANLASSTGLDLSSSKIFQRVDFDFLIFFKNFILIFLAILILFSVLLQVHPFFLKK